MVADRKLAGLLAEADLGAGEVRAVVVGAGANLAVDAFPPELADLATSVAGEAGRPVDRDALLDAFLDALDARLACTSRVLDVRNASSAVRSASMGTGTSSQGMPSTVQHSMTSARVTPSRQPADAGGVRTRPSCTTNTLDPVASHRSPRVLANTASLASCAWAKASARTFSA